LQAAIEQNERYESYIVTALLKMDDMERMIESLREGWFKVLRRCIEGYSIEESQNQIGYLTVS
jgi:pSer/pThr/pTyr-binding forkhead associated (FHA) protein